MICFLIHGGAVTVAVYMEGAEMETKYECPFCGTNIEHEGYHFIERQGGYQARCCRCEGTGPEGNRTKELALAAFCIPAHFAERVKAELVPVAVAKTEAERLRVAGVGDVVTLDDGRRVRVEIFELGKKCCELCVFSADDEACNAAPCFIGARPIHRDSVYFEEVCDGE